MKTLFTIFILLILSVPGSFAQEAENSPAPDNICVYMFSAPGWATVSGSPLRKRITCRGEDGTCWGIGTEDGRLYIDIFDLQGNLQSYWINKAPDRDPDTEGEATNWNIESIGNRK